MNECLLPCFGVQDYKEAARLRDSLRLIEEEEPVLRLRRLMKEAIADERFEVPLTDLLLTYKSSTIRRWLVLYMSYEFHSCSMFNIF